MGKRVRALTIVMAVASAVTCASGSTAHAIHGLSDNHVADQDITYRLHSVSLNSAQRAAIEGAADEWRSEMGEALGGLDLDRGSNYTGTTPKAFRDQSTSTRLVWEDNFPTSMVNCVYPMAIACYEADWKEVAGGDDHITDVDIVFHENVSWPSGNVECAAGQGDPDAVDISADGAADQFSYALHEFGHAFHLKDAGSAGSLMSPGLDGGCWRDVSNHDRDTAYDVYGYITDPGHSHVGH